MSSNSTTFKSLADFSPDWIVTPGDTIADLLDERDWSQVDLATRTGFIPEHLNQLLKGEASITQGTAAKLEKVLGSSARFWINVETQYRQLQASRAELDTLTSHEKRTSLSHMPDVKITDK